MKYNIHSLLAGLTLASLPASAATSVLTSGHVDFIGIGYEDGELEPHSHVEQFGVVDGLPVEDQEYEAGDLIVQVSTTSLRSTGAAWDPIGVAAEESFWSLPELAIDGQPFVGFGAEELVAADWSGPILVTLTGANIPAGAQFSMWQTAAGIPTFYMSTNDGISAADSYSISAEGHEHFGWAFTKQGDYDLTFDISGTHAVDGFKSATATYSFSVVPEVSSTVPLLGAFGLLAFLRRRK